jgi:hypothetical protein
MGLLDAFNGFSGGTGGFFDGYSAPDPSQGLLGDMYDTKALSKAKRKRALLQAGLAMMAQGPSQYPINMITSLGQGLQQGVQGANEYEDQYRKQAMDAYGVKAAQDRAAQDQSWRESQFDYSKGINERDFNYRQQQDARELQSKQQQGGKYFGNPLGYTDAEGNYGVGLAGQDGRSTALPPPVEGGKWVDPYTKSFEAAKGKTVGTNLGERIVDQPRAKMALDGARASMQAMKDAATSLTQAPGLDRATGAYSMVPSWPGGDAASAEADLETLKAKVGFNALQAMREASKTGGALGSIAVQELTYLQNSIASLDPKQGTDQFKLRLQQIADYTDDVMARLDQAYAETYGQSAAQQPQQGSPPPQPAVRRRFNPQTGNLE